MKQIKSTKTSQSQLETVVLGKLEQAYKSVMRHPITTDSANIKQTEK